MVRECVEGIHDMKKHQFIHTYKAPLGQGLVINTHKPGLKIAQAITEIQNVLMSMQGTDGEGEGLEETLLPDATGVDDYKVLQAQSDVAVWDWVRATG